MTEKVFVNYVYDSCYSISYGQSFLIFDYSCGFLDISESKHILFFASSKDNKHYTNEIFNLPKLNSVNYILNADLADLRVENNIIYLNKDELGMKDLKKLYSRKDVILMSDESEYNISCDKQIHIKSYKLTQQAIGFLIEIGDLVVFFAGSTDINIISNQSLDRLFEILDKEKPDLIFFPIAYKNESNINKLLKIIEKSKAQIFFPTKIGGREQITKDFAKRFNNISTNIRQINKANQRIEIEVNEE